MTLGPVVANSSPLIAFERLARLDLLLDTTGRPLLVPDGVRQEVFGNDSAPSGIEVVPVADVRLIPTDRGLGLGEREAIALALERQARIVLLDDLPARRAAAVLRLRVTGTAGVLVSARRKGLISAVRPLLDDLLSVGFRLSPAVIAATLAQAGEPLP